MPKKAFLFFTAVTPAGARQTLYRTDLKVPIGRVVSEPATVLYEEEEVKDKLFDMLTDSVYLPTNIIPPVKEQIETLIELAFSGATEAQRSTLKGSIHEIWVPEEARFSTFLKVVAYIQGIRSTSVFDINAQAIEPGEPQPVG